MHSTLLIMTATIAPGTSTPSLARANSADRLDDYKQALNAILSTREKMPDRDRTAFDIAFAENSGYDLSSLRREFPRVTFVSVPDSGNASTSGKGNGEAAMLESVLSLTDEYSIVGKLTGRLRVQNLNRCMEHFPEHRFARVRISADLKLADSRLFFADRHTWRQLITGLEGLIREPEIRYFEHALRLRVQQQVFEGMSANPFPRAPIFNGHSGSTNATYGGRRQQLMSIVEPLARKLTSNLWA